MRGESNGETLRQFLHLLDWGVRIDPQDLYHELEPLLMLASLYQPLFLQPDLGWTRIIMSVRDSTQTLREDHRVALPISHRDITSSTVTTVLEAMQI
jgi:hypothetical protein